MEGAWTEIRDRLADSHPDLQVGVVEHDGHGWLDLAVDLGPIAGYRLDEVLAYNFDLSLGQLRQSGDNLVLRQTLPLEHIVQENVDETADGLYAEAERARALARGSAS